jgi:hypothetical protein
MITSTWGLLVIAVTPLLSLLAVLHHQRRIARQSGRQRVYLRRNGAAAPHQSPSVTERRPGPVRIQPERDVQPNSPPRYG